MEIKRKDLMQLQKDMNMKDEFVDVTVTYQSVDFNTAAEEHTLKICKIRGKMPKRNFHLITKEFQNIPAVVYEYGKAIVIREWQKVHER